jgi:hypothetical protein
MLVMDNKNTAIARVKKSCVIAESKIILIWTKTNLAKAGGK